MNLTNFGHQGTSTAISRLPTPTNKEDMAKFVDDILNTLKKPKRGHEKRWKEAVLMLAGEQWLAFDHATNEFRGANMSQWTPKPVTNYLAKMYDRLIDIFTSGDLTPNSVPATDDQRDIDASSIADHLLRNVSEQLKTPDLFHSIASSWYVLTGNVVFFAGYDINAGEVIKVPRNEIIETPFILPDGSQLSDADGNPVFKAEKQQRKDNNDHPMFDEREEGQVVERVISPFMWYPESVELPHQVTYGVETQILSLDQLKEAFGSSAAEDVDGEDISEFSVGNFLDNKMLRPINEYSEDEHVILKTYRSRPSERWEEGKVIMTAGGKVLHESKLEHYYDGKLPYVHVRAREIPGEFWGVSQMDAAMPLQKRINAIDSSIVQHRKTMVMPQIFEPKGANIGEVTGRSGARIQWDWKASGGNAPTVKPSVPLSPEVMKERETAIIDIEQIVGTIEVLSGAQPSGVSTLGQTQILAEQALRRFAPLVRRWRSGLATHEQFKLKIVHDMYRVPRLVRIVGENETVETRYFKGADIGNTTDVIVRGQGGIVFSEAMQQQKVLQAAEIGLLDITNPVIASHVMEIMQMPEFTNQFNLDAKLARRRLQKIIDGVPVANPMDQNAPPSAIRARPNDNHQIHFQIYSDFSKMVQFEDLPQQAQQSIMQLMSQHQQQIQQQQQQALQAAQQTRGSGESSEKQVVQSGAVGGTTDASGQELTVA